MVPGVRVGKVYKGPTLPTIFFIIQTSKPTTTSNSNHFNPTHPHIYIMIFNKLTLLATVALVAVSSAAPVATSARHTSATEIAAADQQDISIAGASSSPYSGRGTWFTDSVGSCGTPFDTNDMIVAMNAVQMEGTSQCGREVRIQYGGKTVIAKVTDTCPAQFCQPGALDLSQAVFKQFASLDTGVIPIQWDFV